MRESEFIRQNKKKWKEFEGLFKDNRKAPGRLTELFVQITDDLSYARTFYPNRSVRVYLNAVSQRVFQKIYKAKKINFRSIPEFWLEDLPQILYYSRRDIQVSLFVFVLALSIGFVSGIHDSTFADLILGEEYVEMTEKNIADGDPMHVYKDSKPGPMFWAIFWNNLRVDLLTFFSGILMAVGSLFVILYNGIMVGSFQYFFMERGLLQESFLTIWQHGTLEMSAAVIAGAAGIAMGRGVAFPGTYSRMQAFRLSAKRGFKIMLLVVPMTLLAAIIESWITRYTEIPDLLRLLAIISWAAVVFVYVWWYPKLLALRGFKNEFGIERLPAKVSKPIYLDKVKSIGEIFAETFIHYSNLSKKLLPILFSMIAVVSVSIAVLYAFGIEEELLFNLGMAQDLPGMFFLLAEFIALFTQFGNYNELIWLLPVNFLITQVLFVILTEGFSRYKGNNNAEVKNKWAGRFYSAFPILSIHLLFLLPGGWGIFTALILFPFLALWAVICLQESLLPHTGFNRVIVTARAESGVLFGLYTGITLLSLVLLFLINSPLMGLYADVLQTVIPLEGRSFDLFTASYIGFLYYAGVYLLLPIQFIAIGLYYFHAKEILEGKGLSNKIAEFGKRSVLSRRFISWLLILSFFIPSSYAQDLEEYDETYDEEYVEDEIYYNPELEPTELKRFKKSSWEEARGELDYQVRPTKPIEFSEPVGVPQSSFKFFTILAYILTGLAVAGLLYLIAVNIVLPKKLEDSLSEEIADIEDIADLDLAALLLMAESEGRWRDALRLQFLIVIQKLSEKNLIKWQQDKTNREYLREMRAHNEFKDFRSLTLVFERVWYGDAFVDANAFSNWKPRFNGFLKTIETS
ncbi:MAG: putative membrane protein SpoIIM required for sporulation [Limisphaerales bacterium]|jgi:uncharacterized membrane protein SpoIIM required for sporulation